MSNWQRKPIHSPHTELNHDSVLANYLALPLDHEGMVLPSHREKAAELRRELAKRSGEYCK